MTSTPYPVTGIIYSLDGSIAEASATVTAINTSTGERTSETTNSDGQYILDLANFASGYSDGDSVVIRATNGTNSVTTMIGVDETIGKEEDLDLSLLNDLINGVQYPIRGRVESDCYRELYNNKDITVKTTKTILIPPYRSQIYNNSSIIVDSQASGTITTLVHVSNKAKPGTIGDKDWATLDTLTDSDTGTWTSKWLWTAVTATSSTQSNQDVCVYLIATS